MSIKKLQKIHKNLREIALELEISTSKPKERKGDYVRVYRGRKYQVAQLTTDPDNYSNIWGADFVTLMGNKFLGFSANWDGKKWVENSGDEDHWKAGSGTMWREKAPKNWNPPKFSSSQVMEK